MFTLLYIILILLTGGATIAAFFSLKFTEMFGFGAFFIVLGGNFLFIYKTVIKIFKREKLPVSRIILFILAILLAAGVDYLFVLAGQGV